jgi:hypothetical protein
MFASHRLRFFRPKHKTLDPHFRFKVLLVVRLLLELRFYDVKFAQMPSTVTIPTETCSVIMMPHIYFLQCLLQIVSPPLKGQTIAIQI